MKLNSSKLRLLSLLEELMVFIVLVHYRILCNLYEHYQIPCGTTRFKTSSPRICVLHFLPVRKDVALNKICNLFFFCSWQLIDTELNCSSTQLDCASTISSSETSADLKTPEDIQLQLVALCQHRFVTVTVFLTNIFCSFWDCILMHHLVLRLFGLKRFPSVWILPVLQFQTLQFTAACCDRPSVRPLLTFVQRKPAVTSVKQVLRHRYINCLCFCFCPSTFLYFLFLAYCFILFAFVYLLSV
jgi:hypothetical protein